ncbi:prephenate dehydrogenase/arogenate dehydrogenase family protein [Candidatus Daviesbacteria bacterium]|nr:prephenate dehydrogenase/arogenate dehydrogenase family protein [Candidatus Daviesbacteria bacterium]
MKKISIVGFGRFGQTLYRLIKDDFIITLYDKGPITSNGLTKNTYITNNIADIYEGEVIFYAVPISNFEKVIATHKKYFQNHHVLVDVLSVKIHPAKVFRKYLKGLKAQAILTHPMFGPDSSKNGFDNLPLIIDKFLSSSETFKFWKEYFKSKKVQVIEMTAKTHDKLAASSQGLTHFIGRLLNAYGFQSTPIDSLGIKKLLEVKEQTCNDTWQLFTDLQHFNPYTKQMRIKLGEIYDRVYNKLLPKQKNPKFITFGIQGGIGSFNEEAIQYYLRKEGITKYKIKYLYTSENVLKALHAGGIDCGQFAIHNSVGGIVGESIEAIASYKFKIVKEFAIKISHALMIRKDIKFSEITTIMTHPQVLAQCKSTLAKKYPHLKQTSGTKELIDHAVVAKYLAENKLGKNIAVMGSKVLAEIYNLQITQDNLQDAKDNYTSFLMITRP